MNLHEAVSHRGYVLGVAWLAHMHWPWRRASLVVGHETWHVISLAHQAQDRAVVQVWLEGRAQGARWAMWWQLSWLAVQLLLWAALLVVPLERWAPLGWLGTLALVPSLVPAVVCGALLRREAVVCRRAMRVRMRLRAMGEDDED